MLDDGPVGGLAAASDGGLLLLWAILFFAGWTYAIWRFGPFLGVSLGWVPALVLILVIWLFMGALDLFGLG